MLSPKYIHSEDFSKFYNYLLEKGGIQENIKKGSYIWKQNENIDDVYYCINGLAEMSILHEDGHKKILSFHGKGDIFPGCSNSKFKLEHSIIMIALTDMKVIHFKQKQFWEIMHQNIELYDVMFEWYAKEINRLLYETAHQEYNDTITKICNLLYLFSINNSETVTFEISLTQEEIAEILTINRVNISKNLSKLKKEGVIDTKRNTIIIADYDLLLEHCTRETII